LPTMATMMAGDVAFLHQKGACFLALDPAAEQVRADAFEISPPRPLPGPKMLRPEGEPGALEAAVLEELELSCELFGKVPWGLAEGDRRPLRAPLWEPAVDAEDAGVRLSFGLPKGSYATAVLRELLADAPWFGGEG